MISKQACFVYIVLPGETEFVTAARFQITKNRDGEPIGELIYGKNYLERNNAVAFDPVELILSTKKFQTARMQGFFGAIRDAMPDYWGRRVIERNLKKTILEDFDFLMNGADDRAGALGFGLNVNPPSPQRRFNKTIELEKLQKAAQAIISGNNQSADHHDVNQVQELLLDGTSMGGARPKVVVEDQNCLWIAKFSRSDDRWNNPKIEYAMLNLAKACNLNVADSKLVSVGSKDVLLVRRFDRDYTENGYHRHRMVSALTLLQSEENPTSRANWSYLILADEIRRTSSHPHEDLKELFSRMCFNSLISNLDDHPRNHAIIAKNSLWRLSPAYDLNPMPSIAIENRDLAMDCGLYGRMANYTNLLSAHARFLLSKDEATQMIEYIRKVVKGQWHSSLKRAGVSDSDCKTVSGAFDYKGFFTDLN